MTEKLKAEAYVRKQRPALMELSFGCEVKLTVGIVHLVELFCEKDGDFTATFVLDGAGIFKCSYRIDEVENLKIIGHSINLQDWLAVLEKLDTVENPIHVDWCAEWYKKGCLTVTYCKGHPMINKIVTFDFSTGQPNSPEDYKAFNEITSV